MIYYIFACQCDVCQHRWIPKDSGPGNPEQCPKCKSRLWNEHGKRRRLEQVLREHRELMETITERPNTTDYNTNKDLALLCHAAVQAAKRLKVLVSPAECPICHLPRLPFQMVAHHDDYAKPMDIRWMCHSCHVLHHFEIGSRQKPRTKKQPEAPEPEPWYLPYLDRD